MRSMQTRSLVFLAAALAMAAALAIGESERAAILWLAAMLVGHVTWQLVHLAALHHWLALPRQRPIPAGLGAWTRVLDQLSRFVRSQAEAEQELAAELKRIHAAVDRLPAALIVLDRFDHVVWANRTAEQLHGIYGVRLPIHHYLRQPAFLAYLQSNQPPEGVQLSLASRPGRVFAVTLYDAADEQRLMITRDVTDQFRLDAMRRDFVANVSHEIRTPLTVIGGFVETLLDVEVDAATRTHYLNTILKQAGTMGQLVEDLLTLSALEHGHSAADERVALHAMLAALVADARVLSAGRHSITLQMDGPEEVIGQPSELQSAVRNLLVNAIRYTPPGGRIRVHWRLQDGEGRLSVQDSGIGIAAEHLPRLTERFYRVDRARSRDTGGTGLGLAIVKHVLQRHDAQLQVDSAPGTGSTFTIRLPASRIAARRSTPPERAADAQVDDSAPRA